MIYLDFRGDFGMGLKLRRDLAREKALAGFCLEEGGGAEGRTSYRMLLII